MTISKLDPNVALIVVDLQKGGMGAPREPNAIEDVVRHSGELAAAFRQRGKPVVLVKVVGRPAGRMEFQRPASSAARSPDDLELVAELDPQPEDHIVEKRTWGAFWGTDLEAFLRERGVTQVVVTGAATSIGVDSTAREAYSAGLNVVIALDAVTDAHADAHDNCVLRIFPRIAETGATADILAALADPA